MVLLISELLQALRAAELHAIDAYSLHQFPQLREPMIAVCLTEFAQEPASLDGVLYLREDDTACFGGRLRGTAQLQCYFPYKMGATACPVYLERVVSAVKNGLPYLKTCAMEVGSVDYRPDEDCFCCKVQLRLDVYREESEDV